MRRGKIEICRQLCLVQCSLPYKFQERRKKSGGSYEIHSGAVKSWDLGEGGCGGDFTADPLGAVEPCLNLEVLAQAGRTNKINPETLLRVAVQVSS